VGFLGATVVAVLVSCLALLLMLVAPGLGRDIWRGAGVLIGCNYIVSVVAMAWRGARRGRPGRTNWT